VDVNKKTVVFEDGRILILRIGDRVSSDESTIFFGDLPLSFYGPNGKTNTFQEEKYFCYKTDRIPFDLDKNLYLVFFKGLQDMTPEQKKKSPSNGWGIRDFASAFKKAFLRTEVSSVKKFDLIGRSKGGLWAATFLILLEEEHLKIWKFKILAMGTPFGGTIMADTEKLYPALKKHGIRGQIAAKFHEAIFTGEQWDLDCIPNSNFLNWLHKEANVWAPCTFVVAGLAKGCWLKKLFRFKFVEFGCEYAAKNILGLVAESDNDGVVEYNRVAVFGLRAMIVECSHEEFLSNQRLLEEIFNRFGSIE